MDKLYSESTPEEFKDKISEKIEEAKANGSAEYKDAGHDLTFSDSTEGVVIEDKTAKEVTVAKPAGKDIELVGAPSKPATDEPTKKDFEPTKIVGKPAGTDRKPEGEDETLSNITVSVKPGVTDPDKAGVDKAYSIVFDGFQSEDEAVQFYSDLCESTTVDEDSLTFSDEEIDNISFSATECQQNFERLQGTGDLDLAFSLLDDAEELKAYSVLAENYGHDLSELQEAAECYSDYALEVILDNFSNTDINDYFSEMTEDEINDFFSDLNEVEASVLYSCLEDEDNYTFSEVDDLVDRFYSEVELETPMTELFSEMTDEEYENFVYSLSDAEYNALYSALDEDENLTFSDANEILEDVNEPMLNIFSDFTDEDVETFSDTYGDDITDLAFSMALDEEYNYTYSDFVDVVNELTTFSEEDCDTLKANCQQIGDAAEDLKKTEDTELAKKVKVLADKTLEDAEIAEEQGHDVKDVKEMCSQYSEQAAEILDKKGINPDEVTEESIKAEEEAKKDEPKEQTKTQSNFSAYAHNGVNKTFSQSSTKKSDIEEGQRVFAQTVPGNKVSTINSCLTSKIN